MKKFRFLCANHRQWLCRNPKEAINVWFEAYSRSLDCVEEHSYLEAINHAGAAFEASEIALDQGTPVSATDIHRFADSGVLLAQLLYSAGEGRFARAVLASSISRFEQLLSLGIERKTVLAGCQRFVALGENPACIHKNLLSHNCSATASMMIH